MECLPLKTLDALLLARKQKDFYDPVPLTKKLPHTNPKTLVCHDMKGGYGDDRFLYGAKKSDCYNFIHWSFIDIFVYFSHNLVTIPPYGWISAAHKNGTLILGTFITEWEEGEKICKKALADNEFLDALTDALVMISVNHGFDGWLINIENKIEFGQVRCLIDFVKLLSKKMHKSNPDSLVIWYDSVIESGELKWQNCLNDENRVFFDFCDGIFLNYNWTEQHLKISSNNAGSRKTDVYVGIDVFGRGCPGNGGFNTNIALRAVRHHKMSAAIFAPGWVYEQFGGHFWENQYKFWDILEKYCFIGKFNSLPFSTSFCPGYGHKMFRGGQVISENHWFNLSLQQIQPSFQYGEKDFSKTSIQSVVEDAFYGGGCLKLKCLGNEFDGLRKIHKFKIFSTYFPVTENLVISYTFKCLNPTLDTALCLSTVSNGKVSPVVLLGNKNKNITQKMYEVAKHSIIFQNYCYFKQNFDLESEVINNGWETRHFLLESSKFYGRIIEGISLDIFQCGDNHCLEFEALLGFCEINPVQEILHFEISSISLRTVESGETFLECSLKWNRDVEVQYYDLYYSLDDKEEIYITTISLSSFNFSLTLKGHETIHFHLYPQTLTKTSHHRRSKQSVSWKFGSDYKK